MYNCNKSTKENELTALKRCPFCGGSAKYWIGFDMEIGVICENCSAKTAAQCWSKEEAAEEWNNGKFVE